MAYLKDNKTKKIIILLCLVIFLFSFFMRIIYLGSVPANLNPDEADTLWTYILLQNKSRLLPEFFSFNWNGAPAINAYTVGFFWDIFGRSVFGARFASAFFSSFAVALYFLVMIVVMRNIFVSSFFSIALSVNPWYLNFSRSAWENVWNAFFLGNILLGYEMIERKKQWGWVLCIFGAVAGFYGYHPGKLFVIPLLTILFRYVFTSKDVLFQRLKIFIFVIVFYFILISPQAISMIKNPILAFGRINTVSIVQEKHKKEYFISSIMDNFKGLLLFSPSASYVGLNSRYVPISKPFISRIFLPFFLIGLVYTMRYKKFYAWIFFILLFPVELLSRGTPDASRAVHMVGVYYLILGLGTVWIASEGIALVKRMKNKRFYLIGANRYTRFFVTIMFFCGCILVIFQDLKGYVSWITSNQALQSREPAVWMHEYEDWKNALLKSVQEGKGGFNVYEWKTMTRQSQ